MKAPYRKANFLPPFCLVKKLTVMGMSGYTQGVSKAMSPAPMAIQKKLQRDSWGGAIKDASRFFFFGSSTWEEAVPAA